MVGWRVVLVLALEVAGAAGALWGMPRCTVIWIRLSVLQHETLSAQLER